MIFYKIEELKNKWKDFNRDEYSEYLKKMNVSLNRAKEGKYIGEGNITFKGEKGKEGFTKVQIVEDTVEDKKENIKDKKIEDKKEEIKEDKEEKKENKGGFKKIQIVEED